MYINSSLSSNLNNNMSIVNNPFLKSTSNPSSQSSNSTTYFKAAPNLSTNSSNNNFFGTTSNITTKNNDTNTANLINNNPFFNTASNSFSNPTNQTTINNFFGKNNTSSSTPNYSNSQANNFGINSFATNSTSTDNNNAFTNFTTNNTFQNTTNNFQSTNSNSNFFTSTNKWNTNLQSITEVNEEIDLCNATINKTNPRIIDFTGQNNVPEKPICPNIGVLPYFCEFQVEELRAFNNFKKRNKILPANTLERYQPLSNEARLNIYKGEKSYKENFSDTDLKKLEKWAQDYLNGRRDNFLDFLIKQNFTSSNTYQPNSNNNFLSTNIPNTNNNFFNKPSGIVTNPTGTTWGSASNITSSNITSSNPWSSSHTQIKNTENNNFPSNTTNINSSPNFNLLNTTTPMTNNNNLNSWSNRTAFPSTNTTSNQVTQNVQSSWGKPSQETFQITTPNNNSTNNFFSSNNNVSTPSFGNNLTNSASNFFKTGQTSTNFGTTSNTAPINNFNSNYFNQSTPLPSNQFSFSNTNFNPSSNSNLVSNSLNHVPSNTFSSDFPYNKEILASNTQHFGNTGNNSLSWNIPNPVQMNNLNQHELSQLHLQSNHNVLINNHSSIKELISRYQNEWESNELNDFISKPTLKEQMKEIHLRNSINYQFFPSLDSIQIISEETFHSIRRHKREDFVKPGKEILPSDRDPELFLQNLIRDQENKQRNREQKHFVENDKFMPKKFETLNLKSIPNPQESSVLSKNFSSKNNRGISNNDIEKEFISHVVGKSFIPIKISSKLPKNFHFILETKKSHTLTEFKTQIAKYLEKRRLFEGLRIDCSDFSLFMENEYFIDQPSFNFEDLIRKYMNEIFKTGVNYVLILNLVFSLKFREKYNHKIGSYSKIFNEDDIESCIIENDENNPKRSNNIIEKENEYIPNITKNYKTKPDIEILKKMDKCQLETVKNFEIWNEYGKIKYIDPVDLTYINLDNICIEKEIIKIDKLETDMKKLNKRAELELYGINIKVDIDSDRGLARFLEMLSEKCQEIGAIFLGFNRNGNILKFSVSKMKF